MTIEKLDMQTPDMTDANVARVAEMFPNVVTEGKDKSGKIVRVVDFDALRQELSGNIVEGPQERYRLDWPGKREAMLSSNTPISKTFRPVREESVDFDKTRNLFIEGDNLDALKLLQESYLGKVKMIYIDPPYNTGKDFIYKDNFTKAKDEYLEKSGQIDEDGGRLVANSDSNGRYHSDWLSMIYPRLKLARNLMREDGAIFISIGQEELSALIKVCFEIFGEINHVTTCTRVAKTGGQKGTHFSPSVDYVVVMAKNIFKLGQFREAISENVIKKVYTKVETEGPRQGEKYRAMGLYQAMLDVRANQRYFIECPDGSLTIPPGVTFPSTMADGEQVRPSDGDGVWRWTYSRFAKERADGNIQFLKSPTSSLVKPNGEKSGWNVYYKIWLSDRLKEGQLPGNIFEKFQSRHSSAELKKLKIPFDFPKPSDLIAYFLSLVTASDEDIILDLAACFDLNVSETLVKVMAARKPLRAVFRDDGFDSDDMKINAGQLFKQMTDSHTDMKVI